MKKLQSKIIRTDIENVLDAYALVKRADAIPCKDFIGQPFKLKGYVFSHGTLIESETGEIVREDDNLTIETVDGYVLGTNSIVMPTAFEDIIELCTDNGISIYDVTFVLTQGKGTNGTYTTIETR